MEDVSDALLIAPHVQEAHHRNPQFVSNVFPDIK